MLHTTWCTHHCRIKLTSTLSIKLTLAIRDQLLGYYNILKKYDFLQGLSLEKYNEIVEYFLRKVCRGVFLNSV